MLIVVHLGLALTFLPLRLKEIRVTLGNQAYPNKVLTISRSDIIHKEFKMPEVKRLSEETLKEQLFMIQEAWVGGVVFKTPDNLRSFRHFDTLKYKPFMSNTHDSPLYIIKSGKKYPGTFQIVSEGECLDAIDGFSNETIHVRFNKCNNTDSQLWGAFTEDQVRSFLGLKPLSQDMDEMNLKRMIEMLDRKYADKAVRPPVWLN